MTYDQIYFNALALLGEPNDDASTEDYAARALRLTDFLVKFMYIRLKGCGTVTGGDILDVTSYRESFPFESALAAPMSAYLAAWLIHSADTERSESLKKLADGLVETYLDGRTVTSSVREVYGV